LTIDLTIASLRTGRHSLLTLITGNL